ncbi:MAG: TIGR01459 family HAD-type hydrolase [Parvibaculales bacterium]
MSLPHMLGGLAEIADQYDALIVDIWGVLHNGKQPFEGVDAALLNYRQQGGKVLLLSNAPRPGPSAVKRLEVIGNRRDGFDDILTSGDAVRALMSDMGREGKKICHIGPDKDADLITDLAVEFIDEDAADAILFSGPYDDTTETPDDYADMLARIKARNLPLLCPNPDRTVQFGDQVIYCAGAIAEAYENIGGEVVWVGKPYPMVYARARAMLRDMTGLEHPRLLAIGDGPKTDILGAEAAGIDALFIGGGLASASGADIENPEAIAAILAEENTQARYAMRHLVW